MGPETAIDLILRELFSLSVDDGPCTAEVITSAIPPPASKLQESQLTSIRLNTLFYNLIALRGYRAGDSFGKSDCQWTVEGLEASYAGRIGLAQSVIRFRDSGILPYLLMTT